MLSKAEMEYEIDEGTGKLISNGKSIWGESLMVAGIHTILVTVPWSFLSVSKE